MKYNFIFLDVAGTLFYKDKFVETIDKIMQGFGIDLSKKLIKERHKILSEAFPVSTKTNKEYYDFFNAELLYSLGVVPNKKIINEIYKQCKILTWKTFDDVSILSKLSVPIGIISNWDGSLQKKLNQNLNIKFDCVINSAQANLSKPNVNLYKYAVSQVKIPVNKILYIGDSIKLDIGPASEAGLQTILLDRENMFPKFKGRRIKSLYKLKDLQ